MKMMMQKSFQTCVVHYLVSPIFFQLYFKYFVKENVEVINEASYTYIGALILSMSKRIMNEVMCLAEDIGIDIYITDTDSMHLNT